MSVKRRSNLRYNDNDNGRDKHGIYIIWKPLSDLEKIQ